MLHRFIVETHDCFVLLTVEWLDQKHFIEMTRSVKMFQVEVHTVYVYKIIIKILSVIYFKSKTYIR